MNKNYKIKFRRERVGGKRFWGLGGHTGPQSWIETVKLIAERGIGKVQYIQHCDKNPKNYKRLTGKEVLSVWQAVAASQK
jgi:hypothetical protein